MWAMAQRLASPVALVLEPLVGTGNFIGLVPEQLRGDAKFIGMEYAGLTAYIAKALYPQASILQSGFQRVPLPADSVDLAIGNPPFGKTSLYFPSAQHLNGKSIHKQFFLGSMDAVRLGGLQIMVVRATCSTPRTRPRVASSPSRPRSSRQPGCRTPLSARMRRLRS